MFYELIIFLRTLNSLKEHKHLEIFFDEYILFILGIE